MGEWRITIELASKDGARELRATAERDWQTLGLNHPPGGGGTTLFLNADDQPSAERALRGLVSSLRASGTETVAVRVDTWVEEQRAWLTPEEAATAEGVEGRGPEQGSWASAILDGLTRAAPF